MGHVYPQRRPDPNRHRQRYRQYGIATCRANRESHDRRHHADRRRALGLHEQHRRRRPDVAGRYRRRAAHPDTRVAITHAAGVWQSPGWPDHDDRHTAEPVDQWCLGSGGSYTVRPVRLHADRRPRSYHRYSFRRVGRQIYIAAQETRGRDSAA